MIYQKLCEISSMVDIAFTSALSYHETYLSVLFINTYLHEVGWNRSAPLAANKLYGSLINLMYQPNLTSSYRAVVY